MHALALSSPAHLALDLITTAQRDDAPIRHATGLCDPLRATAEEAREALGELLDGGWLVPLDALVPRRWGLLWQDLVELDQAPARPSREAARLDLDRWVYLEVVDRWRLALGGPMALVPRDRWLPGVPGRPLVGQARRSTLARLRDPARPGGALLWPWGALLATAEVQRAALRAATGGEERVA